MTPVFSEAVDQVKSNSNEAQDGQVSVFPSIDRFPADAVSHWSLQIYDALTRLSPESETINAQSHSYFHSALLDFSDMTTV